MADGTTNAGAREAAAAPDPADLTRVAAAWLARRDRGLSPEEAAELAQWRARDARHESEFQQMEADWARFDLAKELPELRALAEELERTTRAEAKVVRSAGWRQWGGYLAVAAAAALAVSWVWPERAVDPAPASTYRVLPNAARTLVLEDGSGVELRGDSEVQAEFSPAERRVRLVRGEAHFTVTKNPARPFVVTAGPVAVRAVGTAFNVRLDAAVVDVLVTEGRVQVEGTADSAAATAQAAPPLLAAGQRLQISLLGGPAAVPAVAELEPGEIDQALAWQNTWLVFTRTPLEEAVEAFNRHAGSPGTKLLVLGDAALRGRRLGGTFRADNTEGFVRLLEQGFDVRAELRGEREIVLRAAR